MRKSFTRVFVGFAVVVFLVNIHSCSNEINSPKELFSAIEKKYRGKWFDRITFCRTANYYDKDTIIRTEKWISEYKYPGQTIVKINHENSPNGCLYRNDSVYIFENNKIVNKQKYKYDLLIFCMDIYNIPKDIIHNSFAEIGFNMDKFHICTHGDNTYYVVGAEKDDLKSDQVWFNSKNFLVEKVIKNVDYGIIETSYENYINVSGFGWINQDVTIKVNDEIYFTGSSYDINIPDEHKYEINVADFVNHGDSLLFENEDFNNKYYYKGLETFSQIFRF